jgi:hypothetical protein
VGKKRKKNLPQDGGIRGVQGMQRKGGNVVDKPRE